VEAAQAKSWRAYLKNKKGKKAGGMAKIREVWDLQKLNFDFQIDHTLAQGLPSTCLGNTHYPAPPTSLIIGWKSPGSSLPIC
jgi:hypothetical protein